MKLCKAFEQRISNIADRALRLVGEEITPADLKRSLDKIRIKIARDEARGLLSREEANRLRNQLSAAKPC